MINFNGGQYLLDGKDLYLEYGFIVSKGKSDLLQYPKAKERFYNDWPDENGKEWDLDAPIVFEDPIVNLTGYLLATHEESFLVKRYRLFTELRKPGTRELTCIDISEAFKVFYLSSSSSIITRAIKGSDLIAWPLGLELQTVDFVNDDRNPETYVLGINSADKLLGIDINTLIKTT